MLKISLYLAISLVSFSAKSYSFELAIGGSGVDEGDDRYRPATSLHIGYTPSVFTRVHTYGRKMGPFLERTAVTNLSYRFAALDSSSSIYAGIGASLLWEHTSYEPTDTSTTEADERNQYNFGTCFSLEYRVPINTIYLSFIWDSHLFLAGEAGLLMVTARKHFLGINTGIHF